MRLRKIAAFLLAVILCIGVLAVPALAVPEGGEEQLALLKEIAGYLGEYALYPPENLSLDGITAEALEDKPELFDETVQTWLAGDKYGYLLKEEEYENLVGIANGPMLGLMIDLTVPTGIYIAGISPGSPAAASDIEVGAQIVSVDGTDLTDAPYAEAAEYLAGDEGDSVTLGYMNPGSVEIHQADLVFSVFELPPSVTGFVFEGTDIGYISITQFSIAENIGGIVGGSDLSIFHELYNITLPEAGAESVIIDLRGNPGGELNMLYAMLCFMIGEGDVPLFNLIGKSEELSDTLVSHDWAADELAELEIDGIWEPENIVILVNGMSASASEIFAGSLQANGIAELVGEVTYGKAHGQLAFPLTSGDYLLSSVYRVELPEIGSYEDKGITPDHEVAQKTFLASEAGFETVYPDFAIFRGTKMTDRVIALQQRLSLMGYYRTEPTGVFDEYTVWALNRFQAMLGMRQTEFASVPALRALDMLLGVIEMYEDTQLLTAMELCS